MHNALACWGGGCAAPTLHLPYTPPSSTASTPASPTCVPQWLLETPELPAAAHSRLTSDLPFLLLLPGRKLKARPHVYRQHTGMCGHTWTDTDTHRHMDTQRCANPWAHTYTDMDTCIHKHTWTHMYNHAQAHKENTNYRHGHMDICTHGHIHVQDMHTHRHTSTEAYTHRHTSTNTQVHAHTHIQTQVHGHVHTHRHTDRHAGARAYTNTWTHACLPTGTQQTDTCTQTCTHPQIQHVHMLASLRPHSPGALSYTLSLQQFALCAMLAPGLWAQALLVLLSLLGGAAVAPSLDSTWGAAAPGIACEPC